MCRFIVYKGVEPIQLSHLVTRPRHSITNQAFESKLRAPSARPLNADGFGIGWYDIQPPQPPLDETNPHPTASPGPGATKEDIKENLPKIEGKSTGKESNGDRISAASPIPSPYGGVNGGLDKNNEEARKILEMREKERELENERPCVFKSISPAWSNANLERLAEKIRSPLVFAHVRASTSPGAPSEDNCHPWMFDKLMWMHNGEISGFSKIKRKVQNELPEELFLYPAGYTDSEWAFMVFLSMLKDPHARSFSHVELREAMMNTIHHLNKLLKEVGHDEPSLLNFVVSDGHSVVATRYINSRSEEASSLFFASGTSFDEYQQGGLYRITKADKRENIIMIASEPLTFERSEWMEVKTNTMIVITPRMNLLQIPIIDEFWVPPHDPSAKTRSRELAINMGFGHGFAAETAEVSA